jgi:hypothetical protein
LELYIFVFVVRKTNLTYENEPESSIKDFDCDCHELPTLQADGRALAAGADVVVVGHVDIENLNRKWP